MNRKNNFANIFLSQRYLQKMCVHIVVDYADTRNKLFYFGKYKKN